MRADRLVAILLMLQRRGQVTAAEVADELEVSERTARRDLDALGLAGLPVYSRQGKGGGWHLAGGGRTDLSGLTSAEARALFLVAGPSSTATPDVRAALRKLVRALPEQFRVEAEAASNAVIVDPRGWGAGANAAAPVLLDAAQQAVVEARQIRLGYVARDGATTDRVVHPLGLAAKGPHWYLVADTAAGLRTFRVDRMASVTMLDATVVRPPGFDLADAWRLIADEIEERRTPLQARALVDPAMLGRLRSALGSRLRVGPGTADGRVEVELRGHGVVPLAAEIAGFAAFVEVLDPPELRACLAGIGAELTARYGSG